MDNKETGNITLEQEIEALFPFSFEFKGKKIQVEWKTTFSQANEMVGIIKICSEENGLNEATVKKDQGEITVKVYKNTGETFFVSSRADNLNKNENKEFYIRGIIKTTIAQIVKHTHINWFSSRALTPEGNQMYQQLMEGQEEYGVDVQKIKRNFGAIQYSVKNREEN